MCAALRKWNPEPRQPRDPPDPILRIVLQIHGMFPPYVDQYEFDHTGWANKIEQSRLVRSHDPRGNTVVGTCWIPKQSFDRLVGRLHRSGVFALADVPGAPATDLPVWTIEAHGSVEKWDLSAYGVGVQGVYDAEDRAVVCMRTAVAAIKRVARESLWDQHVKQRSLLE